MRWNDIAEDIKPGKKEGLTTQFDDVWTLIERDCSDCLAANRSTGQIAWRGFASKPSNDFFVGRPRINRKPKTSEMFEQEFTNRGLKLLGFETNRSNSIAITSRSVDAVGYGVPFMIFPKNGFKFLYGNVLDLIRMVSNGIVWKWMEENYPAHFQKVEQLAKENGVYKDNPATYVPTNTVPKEFMFKYITRHPSLHKAYWASRIEKFELTDKDFATGLNKGVEIMISHCEYYAIDGEYRKQVMEKLGIKKK